MGVDSIKLFAKNEDDAKTDDHPLPTEVIKASLKKLKRSKEKVDTHFDKNWLCLVDVCRASIIHNNFKELYFILLILAKYKQNCFGFEIVKIENGYKDNINQRWAVITLLIKPVKDGMDKNKDDMDVECTMDEAKILEKMHWKISKSDDDEAALPGHVCEVQFVHRA